AGELAVRLGLPAGSSADLDGLSAARTAAGIAALLVGAFGEVAAPVASVAPAVAGSVPAMDREAVLGSVLAVVAERTGYPVEMIEPELDLEADLSVDSIKRAEIAGELAVRLGLPAGSSADLDGLSAARTAAGIAGLLVTLLAGPAEASAPAPATPATPALPAEPAAAEAEAEILAPQRLEFTEAELPEVTGSIADGSTVLLLGGGELAPVVAERLRAAGAVPTLIPAGELPGTTADAVIHLDALVSADAPLPEAFPLFQAVLAGAPRRLLSVEHRTEGAASGLRGFFRSVAREYPDLTATLVEVAPDAGPEAVAEALATELAATDREPVVLTDGGTRRALRLTPTDLGALAATGAGPAGDGVAEAEAAGLDRDAVVLLVGGARGITARFARTIAAAGRCRIELMGRTPVPAETEDPATAGAADRDALRAAFLRSGLTSPAEVERRVSAVLAAREVRGTVADLRALGSQVRYHCVDVLDTEAVRAAVKDIHTEHGRLDGVVYAAGVIEDKLIAEKPVESFRRVFTTKVAGARAVLDAVDTLPEGPRFAVLFGSIAGALGNRGQSDYAAANDALEELGRRWSTRERRGLTVHWGPWAASETNGGMVTPELMRSYAARGIKLIDPEEGPLSLLRELAWGAPTVHATVYTASGW
ncbi:SDR family NAD(P)-dependent oxidoreductase, partial [Streptomyces sp. NPDC057617]|uniref:SDR family NAD(P)-dependent oxidoreductase n=1 Tax=Streptomyces sp. NPDC057617 TaxID=3346184 RepID=UPI00369D84C9